MGLLGLREVLPWGNMICVKWTKSLQLLGLGVGLIAVVISDIGCDGDEAAPAPTGTGGATGGAGGGSGTGTGVGPVANPSRLGAACQDFNECGGLSCSLPDPGSDPSGFAGGLCTRPCQDSATCEDILPDARCILGFCVEPCDYGPTELTEFDSSKCHGRADVGCFEVLEGSAIRHLCLPNCNGDDDCGGGMFCEPGEGFCRPVASEGSPDGWPCNSDVECLGMCIDNTPTQRGVCARVCTLGHVPSCGWDGSSVATYGCLIAQQPSAAGIGDGGFCGELCDCDDDCSNPGFVCSEFADVPHLNSPWAEPVVTNGGRVGLCVDGDAAVGGSPGIPCGAGGAGGSGGGAAGGGGGSNGGAGGAGGSGGQ